MTVGDRPRARQGQPRPRRSARRGADGFHDVATVYHAISLYDEVVARRAADELTDQRRRPATARRSTTCRRTATNLAVARRAARSPSAPASSPLVRLHITKGIPVAGGMAGGSADAAAALVACDALWRTGLAADELLELAAELGSDVPFSLVGGTALGTGRGELLTPVLARGRFEWVFAVADGGLSTPTVYAECDRLRGDAACCPSRGSSDALMARCGPGDADALGAALHNDLQAAACSLRPDAAADARDRRGGRRARRHGVRQRADRRVPRPRARSTPSTSPVALERHRHLPRGAAGRTARSPAPARLGERR